MINLLSDTLTQLRNGSTAKKASIIIKSNNLISNILKLLKDENFILNYIKLNNQYKVFLKYLNSWPLKSKINFIIYLSTPGRRIFKGYHEFDAFLRNFKLGNGILVISTSIGILTHFQAKQLKIGGELLFYIE